MSKVYYRFFGGLLNAQTKWLNRMAQNGHRLVRTGKIRYEFKLCAPGQYGYQAEFVGNKSRQEADDYARFLKECGYRVLPKNINLDFSLGKVKWRPWANDSMQIATKRTTLGRELFIVEKEHDGRPFDLHTTMEDRIAYCKTRRKPWLFLFAFFAAGGVLMRSPAFGIFAACLLVPLLCHQRELCIFKEQANIHE